MSTRRSVLFLYFLLGAFAVCAQAILLRETQVVLFGSELSWGLVLAFWLAGVALGAQTSGRFHSSIRSSSRILAAANIAMPLFLVAEIVLLRNSRALLATSPGEYIGPGGMLFLAAIATIPVSFWIGLAFPAASDLLGREQEKPVEGARSVGIVYLAEASGSLVGGALYSFVFVTALDAFSIVLGGGAILASATALVVRGPERTKTTGALALVWAAALAAVVFSAGSSKLGEITTLLRWQSFAPGQNLVATEDSRFQNIAVGNLSGQFSLYTNGTVAATWPDHSALAIEAHLAACQHPEPRRMLVLGGGVEGLLKELLRHRPESIDYVTLDGMEQEVIAPYLDDADRAAIADPRVRVHLTDARRFVKNAVNDGNTQYDLILVAAPEPSSALLARLYTSEFFVDLSGVMSDSGVLALSLSGSVGIWSAEVAEYVGSVVAPLEQTFSSVLLTFSDPVLIFATMRSGVITDNGNILAQRYRAGNVTSPFFDPLWFEGASDLLDPDKRQLVLRALQENQPRHLNTDAHPAAAFYHMLLWQSTTGSAHRRGDAPVEGGPRLLASILDIRLPWIITALVLCATVVMGAGLVRGARGIRQTALLCSVGSTGFAMMAIEIVLLYTFQVMYGYVYSMVGLVIGIFMAGLVLGGFLMNKHLGTLRADASNAFQTGRGAASGLVTVLVLDATLALFAIALLPLLALLRGLPSDGMVQAIVYCLVALAGILGGLLFPLAALVRLQDRPGTARAAAAIDATDHMGGSAGALVTGVMLVPVLGISSTCLAVATMKLLSCFLVAAGVFSNRRERLAAASDA